MTREVAVPKMLLFPLPLRAVAPSAATRRTTAGRVVSTSMVAITALLLYSLVGCGADSMSTSLQHNPTTMFWGVSNDVRATTVAVNGTQKVTSRAYDYAGNWIDDAPPVLYVSRDSTKVRVSQDGTITGVRVSSGTLVLASIQIDNMTHADTTVVNVTAAPAVLDTFSIHPPVTTSTLIHVGRTLTLPVTAKDNHGVALAGLAVVFTSLDTNVATVNFTSGLVSAKKLGTTQIVGTTTSYGTTKSDTVTVTTGYPLSGTVTFGSVAYPYAFVPGTIEIAAGGSVAFQNSSKQQLGVADSVDITFTSGVENIPGGNIPVFISGGQSRTFPVAGTYTFINSYGGQTGKVIVH